MTCRFCCQRHHSMLHKHPESRAPVVDIATRDQPLQAMGASGPSQQTHKGFALALEQQPTRHSH